MNCARVSLMDFSDCLLLNLLKYLDSTSLYHLTKVNKRFESLVLDSCLWRKIDARNEPNSNEKIRYCLERMNKSTCVLCLRGETANIPLLPELQLDNFPEHLTILALENLNIDQPSISLNNFPNTLIELSFKNSTISNSSYFFKRTFEKMENLRVLLLDGCSLINSSVVMSVSKYHSLEILSFYKCQIENSIPYFSIAAWHGFKKLKVLDVRLSGLGNPFLKSMIRCTSILCFYFQNMDTSYVLDFKNRKYELEGAGGLSQTPQVDFTMLRNSGSEDTLVTDKGTAELRRTSPKNENIFLPSSFLYTDPYGVCACGYVDSFKENKFKLSDENEDSYSPLEESNCEFFDTENLEKHLDSVDTENDRQQIKEYPVMPDQEGERSAFSKRKEMMNLCQKQPLKKRKRISENPNTFRNDPCTSTAAPLVDSIYCERTSSQVSAERYRDILRCERQIDQTPPDLSHSEKGAEACVVAKSKSEVSSCSFSNTETVECVEDRDRMHQLTERSVPLKKRKHNDLKVVKNGSIPEEASIEISWRNDIPSASAFRHFARSRQSDSPDSSKANASGNGQDESETVGDNDKPNASPKCSTDVGDHSSSDNQSNPYSFGRNVPSTSGTSKYFKYGENSDDGERPSTSGATKNGTKANSSNDINAEQEDPSGTPPRNPPFIGVVYPQHQIGVIFRNRINENNRNVLQICIRGNRERRNLLLPGEVQIGQGVDFPIVLNAVRMINFMMPADQQDENQGQNQDFELVNVNMNHNRPYNLALKRLSFRGYTKVTDVTLSSIEHLNLELLDLTYTRVTKKGIQTFLRMNPNCRVLHKEFCVCRPNFHF